MTDEQVATAIEYFKALWPQSLDWPQHVWGHWANTLGDHGPHWIRLAFRQLTRDTDFKRFAPGLAALEQRLDDLEYPLRANLAMYEERKAAALQRGDHAAVAEADRNIAKVYEKLAR